MFNLLNLYNHNYYFDTLSYQCVDIENEILFRDKCIKIEKSILEKYSDIEFDNNELDIYNSIKNSIPISGTYRGVKILVIPYLHNSNDGKLINVYFYASENFITNESPRLSRCKISRIR